MDSDSLAELEEIVDRFSNTTDIFFKILSRFLDKIESQNINKHETNAFSIVLDFSIQYGIIKLTDHLDAIKQFTSIHPDIFNYPNEQKISPDKLNLWKMAWNKLFNSIPTSKDKSKKHSCKFLELINKRKEEIRKARNSISHFEEQSTQKKEIKYISLEECLNEYKNVRMILESLYIITSNGIGPGIDARFNGPSIDEISNSIINLLNITK